MHDVSRNFEVAFPAAASRWTLVGAEVGLHLPPLRLDHVVPRRVGQSGADLKVRFVPQVSRVVGKISRPYLQSLVCHQPSKPVGERGLLLRQQELCSPPYRRRPRCILVCSSSCSLVVVVGDVAAAELVDDVAFVVVAAALSEGTDLGTAVAGRAFERRESLV